MAADDIQPGGPTDPSEPGAELESGAREQETFQESIERLAQVPDPVSVFSAGSVDEGQIVRALLEGEGIPAIFNDESSPAMGDVFTVTEDHAGDVLVSASDAEQAKALIESYRNATVTDDMVGEDASQSEE
jgi:hypothetical protein